MKFSVVIPTCDRPASLEACLQCLALGRQQWSADDFEIRVTDDGTKVAAKIGLAQKYPTVNWTAGPRRGPAANRNHGARQARGEWLVFTDDDCLPDATWLAAFAAASDARPDAVILEGRTHSGRPCAGPFEMAPVNETGGWLWSCNFAIRRETFRSLGGFDDAFPTAHLEDVDFRERAKRAQCVMVFVPAALVVHPPRPISPVFRQVRSYRSYFYYARKHGVTLNAAGLGWHSFARWRWVSLRSCRSLGEVGRYLIRCLCEAVLLGPLVVWWRCRAPLPTPRSIEVEREGRGDGFRS